VQIQQGSERWSLVNCDHTHWSNTNQDCRKDRRLSEKSTAADGSLIWTYAAGDAIREVVRDTTIGCSCPDRCEIASCQFQHYFIGEKSVGRM
jgi:hypothetical protein